MNNSQQIEDKLKSLSNSKGKERHETILSISRELVILLKGWRYKTFSRETLKGFFPSKLTKRQQERITTEILKLLLKEGAVKKTTITIRNYTLTPRTLTSEDYGSFKLLSKKNGCYVQNNKSISRQERLYERIVYEIVV